MDTGLPAPEADNTALSPHFIHRKLRSQPLPIWLEASGDRGRTCEARCVCQCEGPGRGRPGEPGGLSGTGGAGLERGSRDQDRQVPWTAPAWLSLPPLRPLWGEGHSHTLRAGRGAEGQSSCSRSKPCSETGTEIQVKSHQETKWGRGNDTHGPPPHCWGRVLGAPPTPPEVGGPASPTEMGPRRSRARRGLTCSAAAPRRWPAAPG